MNEHYQNAKKCLNQLVANDQISYYGYVELMVQLDAMKREEQVPTVEWLNNDGTFYCSNCKLDAKCLDGGSQLRSPYCPYCGAKMERSEEE